MLLKNLNVINMHSILRYAKYFERHAQPADLLVEVVFKFITFVFLKLRHHLGLLEVLIVFENVFKTLFRLEKEFLEFLLTFSVEYQGEKLCRRFHCLLDLITLG